MASCLERGQARGAGVDQREVRRIARGECGKLVDRRHVFAPRGAQREQPLLDALELVRVKGRGSERLLDMAARLVERGERRIERLDRRLDIERRLGVASLEPTHGSRQHRHRRLGARHHGFGFAQILRDLFRLHHAGAAAGEHGLLAGLRRKLGKLLGGMAQPVGLALGPLDLGAMAGDLLLGGAAQRPQPCHLRGLGIEPAIGIEQAAVGRDLGERAVVMLAVDFDEGRADGAQRLHSHGLVVEEGAGAAIGDLHPAQDQLVLGRDVVRGEDGAGRMVGRHVERGRDLALLGPLADEAGIAAPAERQRKGIEQDRFAGAGLPGEHRKPRRKVDVEAVDQDDVSDREPGQHQGPRWPARLACESWRPPFVRTRKPNIQYAAQRRHPPRLWAGTRPRSTIRDQPVEFGPVGHHSLPHIGDGTSSTGQGA